MNKPWLKHYSAGISPEINRGQYESINDLFNESVTTYAERKAFVNFGTDLTFANLDQLSRKFASFLQNVAHLQKGDRVAIQLPNILQYPVAMFGILRAGLVVVNTNPLYTAREMRHQFKDSGAKAILIFGDCVPHLAEVLADTNIETVVITAATDMLGVPAGQLVQKDNKFVPSTSIPDALSFYQAIQLGAEHEVRPVQCRADEPAFLQYTGGTTGVSKGAELTHGNIVANVMQIVEWMRPQLNKGEEIALLALPMYHIFALTVNALTLIYYGGTNVMVTNPRDIPTFIKILAAHRFSVVTGLNTLFNALMNHPEFGSVNFSSLKVTVSGGMPLQKVVADRWRALTGNSMAEGYGLTETSPVVTMNPLDGREKLGSIGLPLPSTEIMLCDDDGQEVAPGESGEIWIRGPQVMRGYWNQPEETAKVMAPGGWFKSGDVGVIDDEGFIKIVDRKKDMILVSGFNVYPNEVEEVVSLHPKVLEVAAIGVSDIKSTEAVKIFVVARDTSLSSDELMDHCKVNLTSYKIPKYIEFRKELPKSNVGKLLRRELREPVATI